MLDIIKQALALEGIDPDAVAQEELPLTAKLIATLFDQLPDEIQLEEEEE